MRFCSLKSFALRVEWLQDMRVFQKSTVQTATMTLHVTLQTLLTQYRHALFFWTWSLSPHWSTCPCRKLAHQSPWCMEPTDHPHSKRPFERPKNWSLKYQVWTAWWTLQHFPSILLQPLSGHLGSVRCCTVTDEDDTKVQQPQLLSSHGFNMLQQHWFSPLGRKLGLSKSILLWVINWFQALHVDLFPKSFDALVTRWDKCLNRGGGYADK